MDEHSGRTCRRAGGVMLSLLALAPVALAAWSTERIPHPRPVAGSLERPSLIFSQYAVNLGEVPPTGTIPAHFDFWNEGRGTLEILKLEASCGCLAPKLLEEKSRYLPGERGRFFVAVKTANETPGPKDYTVRVKYDDGTPRERTVRFRLVVPEMKVTVSPAEVYFYQLSGTPDSREIKVEDHRGNSLEIVGATLSRKIVTATIGEKHQSPEGHWTTPIRIDAPARATPGRQATVLTLRTNDPDFEFIQVPILVIGPEQKVQLTGAEEGDGAADQEEP